MKSFGKKESSTSSHLQILYHQTSVQKSFFFYTKGKRIPNPISRLRYFRVAIKDEDISINLQEERQRRLKLGDDDPLQVRIQLGKEKM